MTVDVNYVAVLIAAIVNMIIGWVWYGPAFGKTWQKLAGVTLQNLSPEQTSKMMKKSMAIMFVGALLMAYVLFQVLSYASGFLQEFGTGLGLRIAFCIWLGFFAPIIVGKQLWEGKSWKLWFIEAGYYLILLAINSVILANWI